MAPLRSGLLLFVLLFTTAAAVRPSSWEAEYRKARHATLFQTPETALEIVEHALRRAGNSDDPWVHALRLYHAEMRALRHREFKEALSILEKPLPPQLRNTEIEIRRLSGWAMVRHTQGGGPHKVRDLTDCIVTLASKDVPAMKAEAYYLRGNLRPNETDVREAMRLAKATGDPILELRSEALLIRAFEREKRFAEAVEVAENVIPRLEKAGLSGVGTIAGNMASVYFRLGDYESSKEYFERAEETARKLQTSHDHPVWLDRLGDVHLAMHDLTGAARWYGKAEKVARDSRHRQLPRTLSNLAQVAIARGQLGEARRFIEETFRRDKDKGEDLWRAMVIRASLEIASHNFDPARKDLEDVIAKSADQPFIRLQAEAELGRLYGVQKKTDLANRYFARALRTAFDARDDIEDEYRISFFNSVQNLLDSYVDFLVDTKQIEKALEVTEESRARTLAEGLGPDARKKKLDAATIAKRANATVLAYWLGTKHSYVWTVTPAGVSMHRLPPSAAIEDAVAGYQKVLEDGNLEQSAELGRRLFQMLIPASVRNVARDSRIIVIADGELHKLNFETLVVPGPRPRWWIKDVLITSANSLYLLGRPPVKRTAEPKLLLVGDAPPADPAFAPLPKAGVEMQKVGAHFPRSKTLRGAAATPQAFRSARPEGYDLLHFAAHGIAIRRRPLDSAVILAKDDTGSYRLFARDIVQQRLTARLVTISSCHGAGMRAYAGEGLVGLAWAFLRAGAGQVIAALWKVDDASTAKLMDLMYAQIRLGKDPAVALREAKLALIDSGTIYKKPKYWAPFVIYAGS